MCIPVIFVFLSITQYVHTKISKYTCVILEHPTSEVQVVTSNDSLRNLVKMSIFF